MYGYMLIHLYLYGGNFMNTKPENRDKAGRFKPGKSGNPGGRKRQPPDVKAALEAATPKAAQTLVILMDSENERVNVNRLSGVI
jgi:hypothetical protein